MKAEELGTATATDPGSGSNSAGGDYCLKFACNIISQSRNIDNDISKYEFPLKS